MAKKILVIDDEELIIKSLKKLLEKSGFEAFVVKRGQDALVVLEEEEFDLIISDIRMPGMNGVQAIKALFERLKSSGAIPPPVIFITGHADVLLEAEAKKLNPVDFIYKPFDISKLVERIKGIFE